MALSPIKTTAFGQVGGAGIITLTATRTVLAEESGTTFILNAAASIVVTLPAPQAGLAFRFVIGATTPTGDHDVVPASSANIIEGSISSPEVVALVVCVAAADSLTFVASKAVTGDQAEMWSDGTNWFLTNATAFVQDGMLTSQV